MKPKSKIAFEATRKAIHLTIFTLFLAFAASRHVSAQGTAFTYQGRLNSSGVAANGNYDFSFSLYAAASGGSAQAGPINLTVGVTNGLFNVTLDFGALPATTRFLDISVRTNGGSTFTNLVPRQQLTPAPYAVLSENSTVAGSVAAANITGQLLNSTLPNNPNFTGTITATGFSGNGATLTNIPESALNTGGTLTLVTNSTSYTSSGVQTLANGGFLQTMTMATNLNGLGRADLVVLTSSVYVYTNNGNGGFNQFGPSLPLGGSLPEGIAVLDANNDGKPDFVVGNYWLSSLVIFTNSGSGFVSNATLTVGPNPYSVVALDVNNDGKLDLISANYGGNTVTIYTNDTHGGFGSNTSYTVGSSPIYITAADMNNDSKKDLLVANSGSNTLSILFNFGNGTFLPSTVVACSSNTHPVSVSAADFNGDGFNDLVTLNADGTFCILTNNGNSTFTMVSTNFPAQNLVANTITVTDFNNDGAPDLVVGCSQGVIAVLYNTGNGTFNSNTFFYSSASASTAFSSIAFSDLNGDGRTDFLVANQSSRFAEFLGAGKFPATALTLAGQNGGLVLSPGLNGYANLVGGAAGNQIDAGVTGSDISGGGTSNFSGAVSFNHISADFSDIGGGSGNTIQAGSDHSGIFSGWSNTISFGSFDSVIAGGGSNIINGPYSLIGGGQNNTNASWGSVIGGGDANIINYNYYSYSVIGGGDFNTVLGRENVIGGGEHNLAGQYGNDTVSGGGFNTASGGQSTVGGGYNNISSGQDSTISGGVNNTASGTGSTVGGGGYSGGNNYAGNIASGAASVISGGLGNTASGKFATVPGGSANSASGQGSFAAGQQAQAANDGAFVWADSQNPVFSSTTSNEFSIRAQNGIRIQSSTGIHLDGQTMPMLVRDNDVFASNAPSYKAGIGRWGMFLEASTLTMGIPDTNTVVVGSHFFQVAKYSTNGNYTTLMLVDQNGQVSPAGGARLNDKPLYLRGGGDLNHGLAYCGSGVTNFLPGVLPDGPVLWGFGGGALGTYAGNNAVLTWNGNGVQINPNNSSSTPALRVIGIGNATTPALSVSSQNPGLTGLIAQFGNSNSYVAAITNDGTFYGKAFTASSDRNQKENFTALNAKDVLAKVSAMPLTEWNYKDDPAYKKHIGPMAQDFYAAFALNGADDKHISMIDEGGVALAAIQGLNQKMDELTAELKRRDAENADLKKQLEELKRFVHAQK